MRRIDHPGPVSPIRRQTVDCTIVHAEVLLKPGFALLDALAEQLDQFGVTSAVAALKGGSFAPFAYYMPALSKSPEHAVYFSDRYEPVGGVRLEHAGVTIGQRNGDTWLHCHGTWRDGIGNRSGGHVIPNEAYIEEPVIASIWFINGASFDVTPNPETAFSLFEPVLTRQTWPRAINAFAVVVRANEDLCTALEMECMERGISAARIRGGVGSLVGASFVDGRTVEPLVTEVFIREGVVELTAESNLEARIDVSLVDNLGGLHEGRLKKGMNPVLVTFELVIEALKMDSIIPANKQAGFDVQHMIGPRS